LDLSANWQYYYDQEEKYKRLCKIKKNYDPSGVFTPNRFCILSVPEGNASADSKNIMQLRIKLAGSETAKEEVASIELQPSAEEKFWKMVSMKREVDKPVLLWDTWRA
jgi:hypothetical protein